MRKFSLSVAAGIIAIGLASIANGAMITGGQGIQVSGGVVFVLPENANNAEGATNNPASITVGHVTITYTNYWTTWSDPSYGDIDAIMAVGPSQPGIITFTADPGWIVTVSSIDLVGWIGADPGAGNIPQLSIGAFSGTNLSYNDPTHNTLVVNQSSTDGGSLVLQFTDTDGDYGYEGLNNIVFAESAAEVVPEPASLSLLAVSGLAFLGRRKR